jgi:hypothetical protein
MSVILKNSLAQRGPDEAAERPHQGWDTSGTKFDYVSNPHEITMSRFFFIASDSFVNALFKEKCTGFFLLELPLADILSNFTGNI